MQRIGILAVPLTVLFFLMVSVQVVSGQSSIPQDLELPRVGVLDIENLTGEPVFDGLADTVRTTVVLTLQLLRRYEVIDSDGVGHGDPAALADSLPADTLLWGSVSRGADNQLEIGVSIYDRRSDRVAVSDSRRSPTLLDVFETADLLIGDVIGAFSGERVGFGSIRLAVSGSGDYRIVLDGTALGRNAPFVDRVLSGSYRLEVYQRIPGEERLVVDTTVTIVDGGETRVPVALVDAAQLQAEALRDQQAVLVELLDAAAEPGGADRALTEALASYVDLNPPAGSAEYFRWRVALSAEYRALLDYRYFADGRWALDVDGGRDLLAASYALRGALVDAGSPLSPVERHTLEGVSRRNVNALFAIMLLAADYEVVLGNHETQTEPYRVLNAIRADGIAPFGARTNDGLEELYASRAMIRSYERAVANARPAWHWLLGGVGVAGASVAGYIAASGVVAATLSEADATYAAYQASTDPTEITALRQSVESSYFTANALVSGGIAAGVVGVGSIVTAITARARSVDRPQTIVREYLDGIGTERVAAAISFFEEPERNQLVLVPRVSEDQRSRRRRLTIGDESPVIAERATVYLDLPNGIPVVWSGIDRSYGDVAVEVSHTIHDGRNILYLR